MKPLFEDTPEEIGFATVFNRLVEVIAPGTQKIRLAR